MTAPSRAGGRRGRHHPRLLLYAMYDPSGQDSAPKVRITRLRDELARLVELEIIAGGRLARARAALRFLVHPGLGSVDAVYVELPTSAPTPADLAFLAIARLRGRPVGIYFRDAYQLFRDIFPVHRARQRLMDVVTRLSWPILRRIASRRFAPSAGLVRALQLRDAVLLPPGTDPDLPDLGAGDEPLVAAIVSLTHSGGWDLLVAAMERVRLAHPAARLRLVAHVPDPSIVAGLPDWVEIRPGNRDELAELLRPARVCVIPLRISPYTDLAVPVRLTDLLALGKPVVSTATAESAAMLAGGIGLTAADEPAALADAISRVLADDDLAARLAAAARAYAEQPEHTWAGRAATIVRELLGGPDREDPDVYSDGGSAGGADTRARRSDAPQRSRP